VHKSQFALQQLTRGGKRGREELGKQGEKRGRTQQVSACASAASKTLGRGQRFACPDCCSCRLAVKENSPC
jgi:hypothetical protein